MSVQKFNSEEEIDEAIKKMLNMIETEKTKTNDLPLHHARRKSREMVVNKLVTKNLADLYAAKAEWTQNKAGSSGASGNAINEASLYAEIKKQENLVSEAKAKDSKSLETKDAIAKLLDLKKQYTTATALEAETIHFDEFLQHILPTGEVQRVIYFPQKQRAIALLQPGALIHGKPYTSDVIPIKIERSNPSQPNQVHFEIRHAEEKLGLPLREGIPVDTFRGASFFRTMEFFIGFAIIGFLASRYGQLIRRQILQKRAEDAASKSAGKK